MFIPWAPGAQLYVKAGGWGKTQEPMFTLAYTRYGHRSCQQLMAHAGVSSTHCGLEDYLSKWTYCAMGNELRPYFYAFPAWMVWMPSAQAAEKITAGSTVHARVIIVFNRGVITFV